MEKFDKNNPNPKSLRRNDPDMGKTLTERAQRKEALIATLRILVDKKLAADPAFQLNAKTLQLIMNENKELFFGVKRHESVLNYFSEGLNELRRALGLPEGVKRSFY